MIHRAIRGQTTPNYLSTDNDPLYRFHQWQADLRVLEVTEIKTVPYVPSVCGAAHRDLTPRMPGPHAILDHNRPGGEATRLPTLL
jgi:hypothetical protein